MALYSIFIDESGNFDDLNNLSLVAGFITTKPATEVEDIIDNVFNELSEQFKVKDRLLHHLTQLKWKKKEEAFAIVEQLFKKVSKDEFSYFLMANELNVKIENPDDTYLNMLCDALANIILNIHGTDKFAKFKIYPAIKKRNSIVEKHLSFSEERRLDFDEIFIKEYSGLVTEKIRNLFFQIGKELPEVEVILKNARHYSPLFLSDYLCNTIYNRDKEPSKTIFETYIKPKLKFNYMFSLTTIRNQIDTSLYNGNYYNSLFMLLKAYEGVEKIAEGERERLLVIKAIDSMEKSLTSFFSKPDYRENLEWAITYLLKNIEFQSKRDKNHQKALLWYRKLINFIEALSLPDANKLYFLILVDKISLLNRSGYLINHRKLIDKAESMIPFVLNSTEIIQKVVHFYNVAAVSMFSMYQFEEAKRYIKKSLNYLENFNKTIPSLLSDFSYKQIKTPELGKALGTKGRIETICSLFEKQESINFENEFEKSLEHLSSINAQLRCYCYMAYGEILHKNGLKAYKCLQEIAKRNDYNPTSDLVLSFFYGEKALPVFMLLLFLNTDFNDREVEELQVSIAKKVIRQTEYFSNLSIFYNPIALVLREWVLFRFKYFKIDDSVTYFALYEFLKHENYHIFPRLILLKLSIYAVEIIISNDKERLSELSEEVITDLEILLENDKDNSLSAVFSPLLGKFKEHKGLDNLKKLATELREIIFV